MKQFIMVQGFGDSANSIINKALDMANRYNSDEVTTYHLGHVLLGEKGIAEEFYEKTGLNTEDFRQAMLHEIQEDGGGFSGFGLTLNDLSTALHMFLGKTVKFAIDMQREIDANDLFKMLMSTEDTEFYKLMMESGADKTKLSSLKDVMMSLPSLASVAVDLNTKAARNELDPIESRDNIIDTVIEVLGRRQKANPCLIGEAGVGKTAIVEGLAQRIADGNVPNYLKGKHIINVDISAVVAGCKFRGDFEEKFNNILKEAAKSDNTILFFDEFHMLVNAGGGSDSGTSASNILKPALARGNIRIIGATTTSEYKKHIEKDSAFERRMQSVLVGEPTVDEAIKMINKLVPVYSKYHNAVITDEVVVAAVKLSDKYIANKKLPDKAITLIDETAARLKANHDSKSFTMKVNDIKNTLSKLTGIDVTEMDKTEKDKLINLENRLKLRVVGQDSAVKDVSRAIKRNKAGIRNETKPIGSFLFVGPTGVGKTELCKVLAKELFGSEKSIIRLDMSEFMEKHSVSRLIGAPPGYVGFEDGGQLTDMVKRKPYSIILLDEVEKAHPDVFNIFLQIMDDGRLTDNKGVTTDFKNTIIIMTSNAGYALENKKSNALGFSIGNQEKEKSKEEENSVMKNLESIFRPEFLNRLDKIAVFNRLNEGDIANIVKIMLKDTVKNLEEEGVKVTFTKATVDLICRDGFSDKYGARNVRRKIQELVEDYLADLVLMDALTPNTKLIIDVVNGEVVHKIESTVNAYCN